MMKICVVGDNRPDDKYGYEALPMKKGNLYLQIDIKGPIKTNLALATGEYSVVFLDTGNYVEDIVHRFIDVTDDYYITGEE